MPPRKTRGAVKRSSSDGPSPDDDRTNAKRPRPDAPAPVTSHITLSPAVAHKTAGQVTYKSRARSNRSSNGSSKLTDLGFSLERKPKALFRTTPSPRAKSASKALLFSGPTPKKKKRARRSKGAASVDSSKAEISLDEVEQQWEEAEEQPVPRSGPSNLHSVLTPRRPTTSHAALDEYDEHDDQPAPLPFLSPVKPIEGPGLEIRTPLGGRIAPVSLQSLSKRGPRTDTIPLFMATPRSTALQIPTHPADESPGKSRAAPVFGPASTTATRATSAPVPSTPVHRAKHLNFTPGTQQFITTIQEDGSPIKKPAPVFGPTPSRAHLSLRTEHDVSRPIFTIQTPSHRSHPPTAPPPLPAMSSAFPETTIPETPTARHRTAPPTFAPRLLFPLPEQAADTNQKAKVSRAPVFGGLDEGEEAPPRDAIQEEQGSVKQAEVKEEEEDGDEGEVSMADMINNSFGPPDDALGTSGFSVPAPDPLDPLVPDSPIAGPSAITGSRSRSASGSVTAKSGPLLGSVALPGASSAGTILCRVQPRRGSKAPLSPLITNTIPLGLSETDDHNMSSPLSSLPEDMTFDLSGAEDKQEDDGDGGDITQAGDANDTIQNEVGDNTIRSEDTLMQDRENSMSMRDPPRVTSSSPTSLPAPTSPLSSSPGNVLANEDAEVDVVGDSSPIQLLPPGSPATSLSSLTDLDEEIEFEEEKPPAKSMIPVSKRPGTPGAGITAQTPAPKTTSISGFTPGPNKTNSTKNGASTSKTPVLSNIIVSARANKAEPTPAKPFAQALAGASKPTNESQKTAAKPGMAMRTRASVSRTARSLAAPTASTAAKTRTKVVTAPPPPRNRITNFMKPNPPPRPEMPAPAAVPKTPRKGISKDDSNIPGSQRSTISTDTETSLSNLSNAIAKLARPSFSSTNGSTLPARPGTSLGFSTTRPSSSLGFTGSARVASGSSKHPVELNGKGLKSSVGPGASRPVNALNKGKAKAKEGDTEDGDDAEYKDGKKGKAKENANGPLRSCVIFVDVRTAEGEDAGSLFIDMLRELGAKVVTKPTPSTTHIVFKSGHQATLTKYKLWDDPRPFLVGIGWVVECVEKKERINEEGFVVKTDEVSALDMRERRRSQLPYQMQVMAPDPNPDGPKFGTQSAEAAAVAKSLEASRSEVEQEAEAAAERNKKRAQQKLFPRVRDRSPT